MNMFKRYVACWTIWPIGLILVFSGGMKVVDPALFQEDILKYDVLSYSLTGIVAAFLPWIEILLGVSLFVSAMQRFAVFQVLLLFMVFVGMLSQAWFRGLDIDCGCYGSVVTFSHLTTLVVDTVFMILLLVYLMMSSRRKLAA